VSSEINVKFLLYKRERERERERERIRIHMEIWLRNGWLGCFAKHGGRLAWIEWEGQGGERAFLGGKCLKEREN